MSAWAKPGVKVVCVADAIGCMNPLGFPLFKKGQVFTIAFVNQDPFLGLFLGFVELDRRNTGHINGFRPLVEGAEEIDLAMFRQLLNTVEEPA